MHEKLIEQAGEMETAIRATKPQSVFLAAAANTARGVITHLLDDEKAAKAIEEAKAAKAAESDTKGSGLPAKAGTPNAAAK